MVEACMPCWARLARDSGRRTTMWGYSEEQIAQFGMTIGVSAFIIYMLFIIAQLARESKAGRLGTFILFVVLAFGIFGFVAKNIIAALLNI